MRFVKMLTCLKVHYRNSNLNGFRFLSVYKAVICLVLLSDLTLGSLQCPPPIIPLNGQVVTKWDGNVAQFTCKPGFVLIGSSTAMCRNGGWNHSPPLCRAGYPVPSESDAAGYNNGPSQYSLLRSLSDLQYQHEYNIPESNEWGTSRLRTNSKRPLFSWDTAIPSAQQPETFHTSMPNDEAIISKKQFQSKKENTGLTLSKLRLQENGSRPSYSPQETKEASIPPSRRMKRPKKKRNKKTNVTLAKPTLAKAVVPDSYLNVKSENDSDDNRAMESLKTRSTLPENPVNIKDLKKNDIFTDIVHPAVGQRENVGMLKETKDNALVQETTMNALSSPKIVAKHDANNLNTAQETTLGGLGVLKLKPEEKLAKSNENSTVNLLQIVNLPSNASEINTKNSYYMSLNYSEIILGQLDMSCMTNNSNTTIFLPAPAIQNGSIEVYRRRHNAEDPFNSYLEVFYACKDGYYFQDSLAHSLYCFQEKWIGELPTCVLGNSQINNKVELSINDDDPEIGNKVSCNLKKGGCEHICEEKDGGIACSCYRGHRLKDDGKSCADINECEMNNGSCQYQCWNIPGTYICFCPEGYGLGSNRKSCLDKNECLLNNGHGPCQDVCLNTEGGYQCKCSIKGTQLSIDNHTCEDIDECAKDNFGCSHSCLNTIGSAFCTCNDGYMLGDDWKTCEDIDECQFPELAHSCKGDCINTIGSYKCGREGDEKLTDQVPSQEIEEQSETAEKFEFICDPGYIKDENQQCVDINECEFNNFGCSHICINTPGSASCSCLTGYNLLEDWKTCEDINECDDGKLACSYDCVNINGSAHCICPKGYSLLPDGITCDDINECENNNGGCDQICVNAQGRHYCSCEAIYELAEDGRTCQVVFCEAPKSSNEIKIICSENPRQERFYSLGTSCKIQCPQEMILNGVDIIRCLENGKWDSEIYNCAVPRLCPPLTKPSNGNIKPDSCLSHSKEGEYCHFSCIEGYRLNGNSLRMCSRAQHWEPQELPVCISDNTMVKPIIYCPPSIVVDLPYNQKKVFVRVPQPKSNIDERYIHVFPKWIRNYEAEFPTGAIVVTFQAVHPISNRTASCTTQVTVQDRQPPITFNCPQPITDIAIGANKQMEKIFWEEPIFKDNVAITYIWKSKEPGSFFSPGTHHIKYIARDAAGNTGHCGFTIRVTKRISREQTSYDLDSRIAQPLLLPFWHKHGCKEMNKLQQELLIALHSTMKKGCPFENSNFFSALQRRRLPPIATLHVRSNSPIKRHYTSKLDLNINGRNDASNDIQSTAIIP